MTTMTQTRSGAATVGDLLAITHEGWMQQVTTFLTPAFSEQADFWSRWACARFVSDQFRSRFQVECALVSALAPLVPQEEAATLAATRAAVESTAEELMAAGRRRETRALTARLAHRFIDRLALWCVEVELATNQVEVADLPPAARRLLSGLQGPRALRQ
jgi:hypothetical protein